MYNKKVCVIGAGYWGKNHIRTLNELGALGGIVEYNKERLNRFSRQYPKVSVFTSIDEALKEQHFSGFTVATPAETHYAIGKKILEAKKHILIEKPFTLNIEHAEELVQLGEKNNLNIMVGHVLLFHPAIIKIKELIQKGKIGKLQYIYSNRLNLGQVRTKENVFWSLAPHDISIFQYFTESYPNLINAHGSAFLQKGIHDYTITCLKYANGVDGHILTSWLHPFKEHRLVVIGSKAMITFEDSTLGKPLELHLKRFDIERGIPKKIDGPTILIGYDDKIPLTEEIKYFLDHLGNQKINISNGTQALEVIKILVTASKQINGEIV